MQTLPILILHVLLELNKEEIANGWWPFVHKPLGVLEPHWTERPAGVKNHWIARNQSLPLLPIHITRYSAQQFSDFLVSRPLHD